MWAQHFVHLQSHSFPIPLFQQTREDLRDGAVGRWVQDAQRMTDSVTMRSSCSHSPRPIVRFLLPCIPNALDPISAPALLTSTGLFSISLASHPQHREGSGNRSIFPKLISESWLPPQTESIREMLLDNSNVELPSSITGPALENAKLGIEDTGGMNSKAFESSPLWKENPPGANIGVDGSARKEENDDLHLKVEDWTSWKMGDPVPKLTSWSLAINVENEPPPKPHSWQLCFSRWLGSSGYGKSYFIQELSTERKT